MRTASSMLALRDRLGDAGTAALEEMIDEAGRKVRSDVMTLADSRFDRRLVEEMSATRVEFAKGLAAVRIDLQQELGTVRSDLRQDLASSRVELLKWSFLFWVGQVVVVGSLMAVMLRLLTP